MKKDDKKTVFVAYECDAFGYMAYAMNDEKEILYKIGGNNKESLIENERLHPRNPKSTSEDILEKDARDIAHYLLDKYSELDNVIYIGGAKNIGIIYQFIDNTKGLDCKSMYYVKEESINAPEVGSADSAGV